MLFARAQTQPDETALDDLTRQRSWAQLEERVTRIAHWLRDECGVGPDSHVALLMHNRVEGVELLLGGLMAGAWVTPINRHLAPDEIAYVVRDSGARVVFADAAHAESIDAIGGQTLVRVGDELDTALASARDTPLDLDAPVGGNMIYTSGTTGRPKGVKRAKPASRGAALAAQRAYATSTGLDGSGPHLVTGPLYHAAPLMFAVYDQANGAPIVIMPHWDERLFMQLVRERRIPHTHLVPTMFVRLLRMSESERAGFDAGPLEIVLHGAAPVAPDVKKQMIEWWGPILVEYWGGTEGGVNTLIGSKEWLSHPGSVGRCLPGFEVFAVDDEGARLPAGETGTLYCRDERRTRSFEYHGDPDKTAAAYLEPGVFTLGDVGRVDYDGHVFLADRVSNMIISGGVNIYPAEIEQALIGHPAVADVAVFGVPDDEWGESVKAAVELVAGRQATPELEAELLAFARERLAGYKVPRTIDFESALPRHPSGKLYVRRLRDPYWADRERRI